jgi:hypothetical protein
LKRKSPRLRHLKPKPAAPRPQPPPRTGQA